MRTAQIVLIKCGLFVDFPCTTMGLKPDINVQMTERKCSMVTIVHSPKSPLHWKNILITFHWHWSYWMQDLGCAQVSCADVHRLKSQITFHWSYWRRDYDCEQETMVGWFSGLHCLSHSPATPDSEQRFVKPPSRGKSSAMRSCFQH